MKVEVKKVDAIKRELKFEIPKERVSATLDEVYKDIGKNAKIKGFRPGKVPRNVLESQHGAFAKEEATKKLIPVAYQEGIQQEKIFPIDYPEIKDVSLKEGVLSFTATLDIKPEIKLKEYKGLKVKKESAEVTDDDINKTIDFFKKGKGDDKDVKIDDEFAKGLGFPTLDEFKKSLRRQLEIDKEHQSRANIENQVVDQLVKDSKMVVPQSLVNRQLEKRVHDLKHRMQEQGMKEEEIAKKEEELRKELKPNVEKDVQAYLIFDKIAELENIEVKEGENLPAKVMEFLLKEAKWEE